MTEPDGGCAVMTKLCLIAAVMVASVTAASAQQASDRYNAGLRTGNIGVHSAHQGGRAQDDDERRAQGPLGLAKLMQDTSQTEGEVRESLRDTAIESGDDEQAVATNRSRNNRAAWAQDFR
jgi:hypothetical protein